MSSRVRICPKYGKPCQCGAGDCPTWLRLVAKNGWPDAREEAKRKLAERGDQP